MQDSNNLSTVLDTIYPYLRNIKCSLHLYQPNYFTKSQHLGLIIYRSSLHKNYKNKLFFNAKQNIWFMCRGKVIHFITKSKRVIVCTIQFRHPTFLKIKKFRYVPTFARLSTSKSLASSNTFLWHLKKKTTL